MHGATVVQGLDPDVAGADGHRDGARRLTVPFISVVELFRIGLGPSSSHTAGPMRASRAFAETLAQNGIRPVRVEIALFGSLAWTGKGHGTDVAALAGLLGYEPSTVDPDLVRSLLASTVRSGRIELAGGSVIAFDPASDIVFDRLSKTPVHPNTVRFRALDEEGRVLHEETWFSVGGGVVIQHGQVASRRATVDDIPYPFRSAAELLDICAARGLTIADVQFANEIAARSQDAVVAHIRQVAAAMEACIDRGLATEGYLPGGLNVARRARRLNANIYERRRRLNGAAPTEAFDLASAWAIAINEENAAGGRVVTAPTNGAAGVLPAVLRHWKMTAPEPSEELERAFFLSAAVIGALARMNASISGAEVGCQGEVGVACAMAAAGLAAASGGTARQVENAAEIGLEHHLGMTCDPIGGLVQIPCIERNAMGAVKAINAASMALSGDGSHRVSLDEVIATMRQTGLDMHENYKETSRAGLAVHVPQC